MSKHLVMIGGGHAHMVTLANLNTFITNGFNVTVIQPSDYHYYSGMGPGMLGGTYHPDDIRFATRKVVEQAGGTFVRAKAESIDPVNQTVSVTSSDEPIPYDVLSCNAGSFVPQDQFAEASDNIYTAKPIEALLEARNKIIELSQKQPVEVAVVGGGPSAVEVAGNVQQLAEHDCQQSVNVRLFGGKKIMSKIAPRIGELCEKYLAGRGVDIVCGSYVERIEGTQITLENGNEYHADIIFHCVGVVPSRIFLESGLATGPDGGLLVNEYLQSVDHPNIFGGGDCIYFEPGGLDKVGVYAVRQNPVLYQNLMASLEGTELHPFSPGGKYLLIYNLGNGEGVFSKYFVTFGGKMAFTIKDYIDRKFIKEFQAIE
ncbi:MAG: pyridine nucleotide-disulfide oxidoreductase [Desulfobulbaceae bacterium]|nr:MAG: pyridine nucleotide-disulfide oxidoreductase [Desulfobulbaceae bacterium]